MAREQARHGMDRPYPHLVGRAARNGHATKRTQGFKIGAFGVPGLHQHTCRGAVGQLRGIARRHEFVLPHHGGQACQAFGRGRRPVAVVRAGRDFFQASGAAGLVRDLHGGSHRDDFGIEAPVALCRGSQLLAAQGKGVLVLAADAVAFRDDVGGGDHGQIDLGDPGLDPVVDAADAIVSRAQQGAAFDAAGDDRARLAHDHAGGGIGHGLQAGSAKAVDGCPGDAERQSGAQRRLAGDVAPGRAFRVAAAQDHILDAVRIDARALHGGPDGVRGQGRPLGNVELTAPGLGKRRARGGNDDGFSHD
ncbi:hypothetical protein D3C85_1020720 [compost metagenome]